MKINRQNNYHEELILANQLAYLPSSLKLEFFEIESRNQEYGAAVFTVLSKKVRYRVAKITPTKAGHFVTIWKREGGVTRPYDIDDQFDFFIVSVRDINGFGQFIFNKATLLENRIISSSLGVGKRGMRVYPPWVNAPNKQSKKTQAWQCQNFIAIDLSEPKEYPYLIQKLMQE